MLNIGFSVDDITYNVGYSVSRQAKIRSSEVSGTLLDKTYFNDVIGTYFEYTVKIVVPVGSESDYADLYEVLTDPVGEHKFVFPYNQTVQEIKARVEVVNDRYVGEEIRGSNRVKMWRSITFRAIANEPTKEPT